MKRYLLDTNIFIQAHRATYPLDVVPSFWNKLKDLADEGIIISIDKVKKEIFDKSAHEDELREWCSQNLNPDFFLDTASSINSYKDVINWASSQISHYRDSAIEEFLETDLADPWLVAYAKSNNLAIVTYETSRPDRVKSIKIPEPCRHFNVEFMTLIDMFRELQTSF
jgi:predicted nucleic acid-binding protein